MSDEGKLEEAHAASQEHVSGLQRAVRLVGEAGASHGRASRRAQVHLQAVLLRRVEQAGHEEALPHEPFRSLLQHMHRLQQGVPVEVRDREAHVQPAHEALGRVHHLQARLQQFPRAEGAHQADSSEDRLPVRDLQAASPLRGFSRGAPTAARGHAKHGQLHLHHVRRDLPHEEQAEQARDHPRRDQSLRLPGLSEGLRETGESGATYFDPHE